MSNNLFIFESNKGTHPECLQSLLFGAKRNWPLKVRKGDLCFLFNYDERMLHGIWEAATDGGTKLVPDAWGGNYPYQVRITRPTSGLRAVPVSAVGPMVYNEDGYVRNILSGERAHNLIQYFAHAAHQKFVADTEHDQVETDYRKRFPAHYTAEDGHSVRSKAEMIIDDWLSPELAVQVWRSPVLKQLVSEEWLRRVLLGHPVHLAVALSFQKKHTIAARTLLYEAAKEHSLAAGVCLALYPFNPEARELPPALIPRSTGQKGKNAFKDRMQTNLKPKEDMSNTQNTLTVKLPYPFRHLLGEIKSRGGRFDSTTKTWSLPDTTENRLLANQLSAAQPPPIAFPEERVRNVATTAVELLNALKLGPFTLCATTVDRVVIEKIPA